MYLNKYFQNIPGRNKNTEQAESTIYTKEWYSTIKINWYRNEFIPMNIKDVVVFVG